VSTVPDAALPALTRLVAAWLAPKPMGDTIMQAERELRTLQRIGKGTGAPAGRPRSPRPAPLPLMPALAFPLSSTPGKLTGEGEGRLINCYASKEGDTVYIRRVAGLAAFGGTTPASGCRGLAEAGGYIVGVFGTSVAKIDGAGTVTTFSGSLAGSGGVTIAHNNRSGGPDVVAVREDGGAYTLNLSTNTVSAFADADLPATVNSVTEIDGYLVFSCPDGRAFATDLNAVTVNALSFATAEAKPDGLVRVLASGNRVLFMGTETIEPWFDAGASPFPFARGTSVIPVGLLTTMAVAGAETGWTQNVFFVAHDRTVRELGGYDTKVVSTPDVERFLAASTVSTIEASVHEAAGRSIFTLSSDQGTWQLDVRDRTWRQRTSVGPRAGARSAPPRCSASGSSAIRSARTFSRFPPRP
jgi:hypothetical protein